MLKLLIGVVATFAVASARTCQRRDVFSHLPGGHFDLSTASIPSDCKKLQLDSIGEIGAVAISHALKVNSGLRELHLENNDIGPGGAQALAHALKINTGLQMLDVGTNNIGVEGAAAVADMLKVNNALTELGIRGNNIGEEGAIKIAEGLKVNTALQTIDLGANHLECDGAIAIAEALKVNNDLTGLGLDSNAIGGEGATELADALKENTALHELGLDSNAIGGEGAAALAGALKVNDVLSEMNLYSNSIGNAGAKKIAAAVKVNKGLKWLVLNYNSIGLKGSVALADALKVNQVLTELDMGYNSVGEQGAKAFLEAVKVNTKMKWIGLKSDSVGLDLVAAIEAEVAHNTDKEKLAIKKEKLTNPCFELTPGNFCNGRGKPVTEPVSEDGPAHCSCAPCGPPWYEGLNCETANPCGRYKGCEAVLGEFVVARFMEIKPDALTVLGVRSVMDLLLLTNATKNQPGHLIFGEQVDHLAELSNYLDEKYQEKWIDALEAAPPLDAPAVAAMHFLLYPKLCGELDLPTWAAKVHLPPAALANLKTFGVAEPKHMKELPTDEHSVSAMSHGLTVVEARRLTHAIGAASTAGMYGHFSNGDEEL